MHKCLAHKRQRWRYQACSDRKWLIYMGLLNLLFFEAVQEKP
jgi:hypothetical protein